MNKNFAECDRCLEFAHFLVEIRTPKDNKPKHLCARCHVDWTDHLKTPKIGKWAYAEWCWLSFIARRFPLVLNAYRRLAHGR